MDSDRTRRDKHGYIGYSSGRAIFFELGVFEFLEFWPENVNFFIYNDDFLVTRER